MSLFTGAYANPLASSAHLSMQAVLDATRQALSFAGDPNVDDLATILGFRIGDLVGATTVPPAFKSFLAAGTSPAVTLEWKQVRLHSFATFVAHATTTFDLNVAVAPPISTEPEAAAGNDTCCTIADFALVLPAGRPLLALHFNRLTFQQRGSAPAKVDVDGLRVEFLSELQLLESSGQAVNLAGSGPQIDGTPAGITAGYALALPQVPAGAFVLNNIAVGATVSIPFDRRPISVTLSFASATNRFALTVLMFGGGYVEIELTQDRLQRLDLVLEFGGLVAMTVSSARVEIHAVGGVRSQLAGERIDVSGYLWIGGCVDVLGLVSVTVELCMALSCRSESKALVGRATVVVEIDVFLWSDSVELDSGDWVLVGGTSTPEPAAAPAAVTAFAAQPTNVDRFDNYWSAFAHEGEIRCLTPAFSPASPPREPGGLPGAPTVTGSRLAVGPAFVWSMPPTAPRRGRPPGAGATP